MGDSSLNDIVESFANFRYEVPSRMVKSSEFGVPQVRHRLLVLATKLGNKVSPFDGTEPAFRSGDY